MKSLRELVWFLLCVVCFQTGGALSAQQPDATQSVVGDWVKNGGAVVTLNADGSMKSTDGDGTWQWTKKEKLQFAVNHRRGSSYTLTLSADGTRAVGEVDKGDPGKIGKRIEMVRKLSAPAVAANPAPAPASQPPAAAETNLLKNGAFENGMDGWNFENHRKQATATKDLAELHNGHPSIRIDNQEPVDSFLVQTVTLKPATRYRFSGWVKAKNVVKAEGQRDGPAGACLAIIGGYTQTESVADAGDWLHVSVDFSSGTTTEFKLGPRLGFYGKQVTGAGWYADLSLVELDALASTAPPARPAPSSPPAPISATKPVSPATALTSSELVKINRSNLVFVTTSDGAGSGFIANSPTGTFLFTNAHVAASAKGATFKTLNGTQMQVGTPASAVGHDIFRMALPPVETAFQIMTGVDENAAIGDEVVVLGNAEGAGVINTINGKIVGIGPNLVEVDAPFQPGNSGSPIVHLKTGKVVGVATYLTIRKFDSATKEPVKVPIVRRFGYRLDSVKIWQPVSWQSFYAQAAEMESIEKLTGDLVAFLEDLDKDGRVNRGAHTNPAIKNRIDQWIEARSKRLSPRDAAMADQSLLSFLRLICQADITAAQPHLSYDYFQRGLADQQRDRKEIADVFAKSIDDLRK